MTKEIECYAKEHCIKIFKNMKLHLYSSFMELNHSICGCLGVNYVICPDLCLPKLAQQTA